MGWRWHQLDHMQIIYTLLQTTTPVPVPYHSVFRGRMPFLPNQHRQSTEATITVLVIVTIMLMMFINIDTVIMKAVCGGILMQQMLLQGCCTICIILTPICLFL